MLDREQQTSFYERIGEKIRETRKIREINQETLATTLGISRVSLINIETGKQRVPLHVLLDICVSLNVTMNELVPQNMEGVHSIDASIINKINKETNSSSDSSEKAITYISSKMNKQI